MISDILILVIKLYQILTDKISHLIPSGAVNFISYIGLFPIRILNTFGIIIPESMHAFKGIISVTFILFFGFSLINLLMKLITMFIPSDIVRTNE